MSADNDKRRDTAEAPNETTTELLARARVRSDAIGAVERKLAEMQRDFAEGQDIVSCTRCGAEGLQLVAGKCIAVADCAARAAIRRRETTSQAAEDAVAELRRARAKFPRRQASAHEGYAVLREEVDELWDEVKANAPKERLRDEAVQVAAMALRFIEEVCDG